MSVSIVKAFHYTVTLYALSQMFTIGSQVQNWGDVWSPQRDTYVHSPNYEPMIIYEYTTTLAKKNKN